MEKQKAKTKQKQRTIAKYEARARVVQKRKIIAVAVLTGVTIGTSACTSGNLLSWQGADYFELRGTPEGIAAFDTYQNGLVTNSTLDRDNIERSPHWTIKAKREDYKALLLQSKKGARK